MLQLLNTLLLPLADFDDFDRFDPSAPSPPPPAPVHRRFSFGDLQKGLQSTNEGTASDRHFLYLLLTMVALIVLLAIILQLRERKKTAGPPNSPFRLRRELARKVRFPFGTRLLLTWAARSAQLPAATLMISLRAFDETVTAWSRQPTFSVIRRWGFKRLKMLRPILFDLQPVVSGADTSSGTAAKIGTPQSVTSAAHQ
jgi:hypothetical protein